MPYKEEYLAGFRAECYQIDLPEGFAKAQNIMDDLIRHSVRQDIGGDRQQIHAVKTRYDNITFKHILLPIWMSAYRYRGQVFRFLVNARTSEVQGERPWSAVKIGLAVLVGLIIIGCILAVMMTKP